MVKILICILSLFFMVSCESKVIFSPEDYSPEINFNISEWILEDQEVTCVDFDGDGNAWIGVRSTLNYYNGENIESYEVGSQVIDIAVSMNNEVWIGTKDKGLGKFINGKFSFYNSENSGLPRDYVSNVEVTSTGEVWFSSSVHMLGGLMYFDRNSFKLYTPENSILNQNIIWNLKIDKNNNVFFSSAGTVGKAAVFKINSYDNWNRLGIDTSFYWISSLDVNSESEVYINTDHSLSSCYGCYKDEIIRFKNNKWNVLSKEFVPELFNGLFIDKRDYVWIRGGMRGENESYYFVFDGNEWHQSELKIPSDLFIRNVKVNYKNDIWICSNKGLFIMKQEL